MKETIKNKIETIKNKLKSDKQILLLFILTSVLIIGQILWLIIESINYFWLLNIATSLLSLIPSVMLLLFVLHQYKTQQNAYFRYALISYICITTITIALSMLMGIITSTIRIVLAICFLVITNKGTKNILLARSLCIAQIALALLSVVYSVFTTLSTILFWVIILIIVPSVSGIKSNQTESNSEIKQMLNMHSAQNTLEALKQSFDEGIITEEEYNQRKAEILKNV